MKRLIFEIIFGAILWGFSVAAWSCAWMIYSLSDIRGATPVWPYIAGESFLGLGMMALAIFWTVAAIRQK